MKKRFSIETIVFVALFAALTFVGTTIKIPLPTGAFVHMGNVMVLLAVLLLGYVRGSLAGGLGFFIFDLLNGYATEAPYFLLESFVVGAAASGALKLFKSQPNKIWQVSCVAVAAGLAKIFMTQLKNTIVQWFVGNVGWSGFQTALFQLPATLINVGLTIGVVSLLYFPLKRGFQRIARL